MTESDIDAKLAASFADGAMAMRESLMGVVQLIYDPKIRSDLRNAILLLPLPQHYHLPERSKPHIVTPLKERKEKPK